MAILDIKNTTLFVKDGTFPKKTTEVRIGEGNLTYDEKVARRYIKNKGLLDIVMDDDQEPVDLSFDFVWDYIRTEVGETVTMEDALKKVNEASTWATTDSDACQPYCVDLYLLNDPNCTGVAEELLLFTKFRYEQLSHDMRNSSVACTGRCNLVLPLAYREQFDSSSTYVLNGTFTTDLTSWAVVGSATIVSNTVRLDYDSGPTTTASITQTWLAAALPAGEYVLDWTQVNSTNTIDILMKDGNGTIVNGLDGITPAGTISSGDRAAGAAPIDFVIPTTDPGGTLVFTAADVGDLSDIDDVVIYRRY